VLAEIGEDQIGRDRGGLVEAGLAPFALDVVFSGEGEAAIGRERCLGGSNFVTMSSRCTPSPISPLTKIFGQM
jgi:hypothetical protein